MIPHAHFKVDMTGHSLALMALLLCNLSNVDAQTVPQTPHGAQPKAVSVFGAEGALYSANGKRIGPLHGGSPARVVAILFEKPVSIALAPTSAAFGRDYTRLTPAASEEGVYFDKFDCTGDRWIKVTGAVDGVYPSATIVGTDGTVFVYVGQQAASDYSKTVRSYPTVDGGCQNAVSTLISPVRVDHKVNFGKIYNPPYTLR